VTSAGVAYCWGDNSSGQLGNGTTTNTATPVPVAGGCSFATVSAGGRHTCGVTGTVFCWGDNSSGQLGNGTLTNSSVPVAAMLRSPQSSETKSAAGSNHTCAVDRIGGFTGILDVFCWGDNSSGQLGNGTMTNSAVPVSATGAFEAVLLSAGTLYTCAQGVFSDVSCWGNNGAGQLGNGTTTNSARGVPLSGALIFFASMSAGALHVCGSVNSSVNATAFSYAYCWGDNSSGQLGNGTTTNSSMPIVVAGGLNFTVVSAGGRHTCGVTGHNLPSSTAAGAVYCWGDNTFGQLGNSWTTSSPVPVNVAGQS
jgi:alpha-tubulin suppressor-like RCC1 family protein